MLFFSLIFHIFAHLLLKFHRAFIFSKITNTANEEDDESNEENSSQDSKDDECSSLAFMYIPTSLVIYATISTGPYSLI